MSGHSYTASLQQHYASVKQRLWTTPIVQKQIIVIKAPEREPDDNPALPPPEWKRIIIEVCKKHGISYKDIIGRSRVKAIANARQECCYRLRAETLMSLPRIGRKLGCIDHTTVLHGSRVHAERNDLPKIEGAYYARKWTAETVAPLVALKTNHSMAEVARITGHSIGTIAGVVRRERLERVNRMNEWAKAK